MEPVHQRFYALTGLGVGGGAEVGVTRGGEDAVVAENLLHFQQIDAGFDQVGGIAVAQAVRADVFLRPISCTTCCKAFCTPPRSSGACAVPAMR